MTRNSPHPAEQRLVLSDVSYQQFENLLVELGPHRTARLTYVRGKLEMMTPMAEHERCRKLLESLILVLADEAGMAVEAIAPVLVIHPELQCSIQPDACYYLQAPDLQSSDRAERSLNPDEIVTIQLPQQPIPDLLVEVSMTKSALNKLAICASLAIPELWQYITTGGDDVLKGAIRIYRLHNQAYVESTHSYAFPGLTPNQILQFLQHSDTLGLQKAIALLRDWCSQQR